MALREAFYSLVAVAGHGGNGGLKKAGFPFHSAPYLSMPLNLARRSPGKSNKHAVHQLLLCRTRVFL